MSATSTVRRGRRKAESLMLDTGRAKRPNGLTVQDPDTGDQLPDYDILFTEKCKIQYHLPEQVGRESAGGREATIVRMTLHLPVGVGVPLRAGDLWEMLTLGPASDAELLGKTHRIVSPTHKSMATALRYEIEEITS